MSPVYVGHIEVYVLVRMRREYANEGVGFKGFKRPALLFSEFV